MDTSSPSSFISARGATGFNVVALVVAALDDGPDAPRQTPPSSTTTAKRTGLSNGKAATSRQHVARPALHRTGEPLSSMPKPRIRRKNKPARSRKGKASSLSLLPGGGRRHLPDAAVEVVLDFLPASQALSMVARSRSASCSVKCSRYALSRLDKLVSGLAAAEDAYHEAREVDATSSSSSSCRSEEDGKNEANEKQGGHAQPGEDEGSSFSQLKDLETLDLIYKRALLVARASSSGALVATKGHPARSRGVMPSNLIRSETMQIGEGSMWAQSGLAASRAWRVGYRLMGLLASGMAANIERNKRETAHRSAEVGIVTDCMHPTTAGNRYFHFLDSINICGLLGFNHFPLVVIPGVCVLHAKSPIYACLPGGDQNPIHFTPTSFDAATANHNARGRKSGGVGGGHRRGEWLNAPWIKHRRGGNGSRGDGLASSAAVAQTYQSRCGRYTAALVRFFLTSEVGATGAGSRIEENDVITRLSYGLGPCRSRFCRHWDVPSHTLVVFARSEALRDPFIFCGSNGRWKFADYRCCKRFYDEWARLLAV